MQQSKMRYILIVVYWICNLLCCVAAFFAGEARPIMIIVGSSWFVLAIKVTIIIHVLVLKRTISKQCMLHVLKVNNKRVMVGECTPREKRIINISLWSIFPFVACNLPFCLATLCGYHSVYLAIAVLLDVDLINPSIWFYFSRTPKNPSVAPKTCNKEKQAGTKNDTQGSQQNCTDLAKLSVCGDQKAPTE